MRRNLLGIPTRFGPLMPPSAGQAHADERSLLCVRRATSRRMTCMSRPVAFSLSASRRRTGRSCPWINPVASASADTVAARDVHQGVRSTDWAAHRLGRPCGHQSNCIANARCGRGADSGPPTDRAGSGTRIGAGALPAPPMMAWPITHPQGLSLRTLPPLNPLLYWAGRPGMAVLPQGYEHVLPLLGGERRRVRCSGCLPPRNAGASLCPRAKTLGGFLTCSDSNFVPNEEPC